MQIHSVLKIIHGKNELKFRKYPNKHIYNFFALTSNVLNAK